MITEIKELRIRIDGLSQLAKELKPVKQIELVLQDHNIKNLEPKENYVHYINGKIVYSNSEEVKESYKSLILAKAWLGKVLQELGTTAPYANDGNRKTVEDIESPADVAKKVTDYPIAPNKWKEGFVTASHIEKVDWLREELKKLLDSNYIKPYHREAEMSYIVIYQEYCWKELQLARFHLGFELQRIKEQDSAEGKDTSNVRV